MKKSDNSNVAQLRTALAISRGMELIENLPQEVGSTVEHDEAQRLDYLVKLYIRIHESIFKNWKQDNIDQRPGQISTEGVIALRKALLDTLCYPNGIHGEDKSPLFDSNGVVITLPPEKLTDMLANFYEKMNKSHPFRYGNELTLNIFMTALGELPAFKEVYGEIDFRRLNDKDLAALHANILSHASVQEAFTHALDPSLTPRLKNQKDEYGRWENHSKQVMGVRFLSQNAPDGTECLVTVNGGLVPFKKIESQLNKIVKSGKPQADYPVFKTDQYLPGTEELRNKSDIDGIPIKNGAAPLLALDFNILTGLSTRGHEEFEQLVRRVGGEKARITDLASKDGTFKNKLLDAVKGDERMTRMIQIAAERISTLTPRMDALVDNDFKGKSSVQQPHLIITMGGGGSGKSFAKDIMEAKCGNNYVEASLDSFRKHSDLYTVLIAAHHHSDDYRVVESYANALRTWVSERAKEKHINILYDGTGIPFKARYSPIAKKFKDEHFTTEVVAVDAPLDKAMENVKSRYHQTKRALSWIVTVGKHVRAPSSFLQAIEDHNVDKVSLFANDAQKGEHHLVAETFRHDDKAAAYKQSAARADYMKERIRTHRDSTLRGLGGDTDALIGNIKNFGKDNVYNMSYTLGNGIGRDLAIYDVKRFTKFFDKGTLNPYASGADGQTKLPRNASFVMRRNGQHEQARTL